MKGANGTDWKALRASLARRKGRDFWRGLEELGDSDAFRSVLEREFPLGASEWLEPSGRREFLKLSAASLALAGLSACTRQPLETIVPYVEAPEQIVPGKPLYFATATELRGIATGVLVESHMGRPTKVEGNARHPAGTGATDVFSQASILELYDPDRSQVVLNAGRISTWDNFLTELQPVLERQRGRRGAGIRILSGSFSSPTLKAQLARLIEVFPEARWHLYEPVPRDSVWQGTLLAFGERLEPIYRFERADVVVAIESDFLTTAPGVLRYTRELAARRRPDNAEGLSRLYAVEPTPTLLGAMADHRLRLAPSEIENLVRLLARELGVPAEAPPEPETDESLARFVKAIASDLRQHRGRSLLVAGEPQPPIVHGLAQAMNHALGNVGATVDFIEPVEALPPGYEGALASLESLVSDMARGEVELLVVLGGNPVFDAPPELGFAERYANVGFRVHLGGYADETAVLSHWHVPKAQDLESWGDGRAFEGTVTLTQPLIEPLYGGRTAFELLGAFVGDGRHPREIVRGHWRERISMDDFESAWRRSLHDGFIAGTEASFRDVTPRGAFPGLDSSPGDGDAALEVLFRPDPTVLDGRFANNGWLQETPKPFTKLTWGNAALVSPRTAERLGVADEDAVVLASGDSLVEAPIFVLPGQADGVVLLHLGYGRERSGRAGTGLGFDANRLRTSREFWRRRGVAVDRRGGRRPLASTQLHHSMEGRALVREAAAEEYRREPDFARHHHHDPGPELSLHPPREPEGDYAWGMSIDLGCCTGCNACVVACQAENNIPVVGREQVRAGREMHWIRVDRYFEGPLDDPRIHHQPVPCMHCENAPCEVVCPVSATVHDEEGLNAMVYNRCVGTRYCSNNCPYKVRRFNFLLYADLETPVLGLSRNPDVTVRTRGVMEKCTYCVQRINVARIEARKEERPIADGEVSTACQQACPAGAIVFGDLKRAESRVSREKASPLSYGLLSELGTRPRTTYRAKVKNPNPDLEAKS